MASQIRSIVRACWLVGAMVRNWQFSGTKGALSRVATLVLAVRTNVYFMLEGFPPPALTMVAILFLPTVVLAALASPGTKSVPMRTICFLWKNPICCLFVATTILIPALLGIVSILHASHIDANVVSPGESPPWKQGLAVRVWWQKTPTPEMESGLADTARILGFSYEPVQSIRDANLRVWTNSWTHHCKWLTPYAFASPDPASRSCGSRTGDIHVCWFENPFADREFSGRLVIAHETAHILAAQPHFGDGLMAEGGGEYATWFTDEELNAMISQISDFHADVSPICPSSTGRHHRSGGEPQQEGLRTQAPSHAVGAFRPG